MPNAALDQLIGALWGIVPLLILFSISGLVLQALLRWLERRVSNLGRASRAKPVVDTYSKRAIQPREKARAELKPSHPVSAATLDDMAWEDFELLAGELFRRQGYDVEIAAGLGSDGGKDVVLRRGHEAQLVQCKHFSASNKVSVTAMREFYGLVVAEGATGGIFLTTGAFSRDALEFAQGKPIRLVDHRDRRDDQIGGASW